ncbi:GNAT family N-acetyltransferase [Cellulomonas fimi]|uniref:GNAT family N-acetyltransferase n=1 Tax=Cellulomonas fimi TaxID=1708 RepID=UPI00234D119E|nr:GNAT family N-acetyltransferase [Cellulomonas fimi]MDC7120464.1 GNAT family N-acetyltransferase [Cellulomonas fimi]
MTYTPVPERIETARLVMTPQVPSDADWLAELFTARGTGVVTPVAAAVRIAAMQRLVAEHGIGARVLRLRGDDGALGYCALVVGRASLDEPELAYELLPAAHGHGYATEGSRALVAAAFATGRTRLWSTVRPWNVSSLRVLDRVGFRRSHTTSDVEGEIVWHVLDRDRHDVEPGSRGGPDDA